MAKINMIFRMDFDVAIEKIHYGWAEGGGHPRFL